MTLTYEILQPVAAEGEGGEGSGASFIKGLSVAAALGLISYMWEESDDPYFHSMAKV